MQIGNLIHGFTVERVVEVSELDATMYELVHQDTNLKLAWLKRQEENKTFGIAFKTLPSNDTGVFHILEHSVLCGSKNYPVKEPFVELMKNSMSTFLNAMTFPDKTFYPISSRNDKDFINLMRVYLDAVFNPSIYNKPEIFRQEGWHYEIDEDGKPSYKGVVLNEMKGAFADAEGQMLREMNKALFHDTPYRYVFGGDPTSIIDLSYEEFLKNHKKYYSPTNGYVFLDGDLDIENVLRILQDEYLKNYTISESVDTSLMQEPINSEMVVSKYEIGPEEDETDKYRIAWGRVIGTYEEREKLLAMQVLSDVLCGNNQAPLTKAVLSKGLAEDVSLYVMDGVYQNWVKLEARNLKEENIEEAESVIFDELREQISKGVDRAKLEATMANLEFNLRERDFGSYPQGIIFGFLVLESWLYGGKPEANLEVGDLFVSLRDKMDEGYFEKLLNEVFFDNDHCCKVLLKPSHNAGNERREAEKQRLEIESAKWDDARREELLSQQRELIAWQNSKDTPEKLRTLPRLELSDISDKPEDIPCEVIKIEDITILKHEINSSGILYYNLYFDMNGYSEEEITKLSFLCKLLGKVNTEKSSVEDITNKIRLLCGGLSFYVSVYDKVGSDEYNVKFCTSFSSLEQNADKALDLVLEILTQSKISDEGSVLDILRQAKMNKFQQIVMSGNGAAVRRIDAQYSAVGVANECANGVYYYNWLKENENNWNWEQLQVELVQLMKKVIVKDDLTISITGNCESQVDNTIDKINSILPQSTVAKEHKILKPWGKCKEGIVIPADISFAARGGYMDDYSGIVPLASKIISLAYLWNVIRVQGGAYGTGLTIRESGFACCHSYRDPNGKQSLISYSECGDFLRDFCKEDPDLVGFIIGTVAGSSPLLMPRAKGNVSDSFYWRNISWEYSCELRKQLLASTLEDLIELSYKLGNSIEDGGICIIGGQNQIDNCELEKIISI